MHHYVTEGRCEPATLRTAGQDGTACLIVGGVKVYVGAGEWHDEANCPKEPAKFETDSVAGSEVPEEGPGSIIQEPTYMPEAPPEALAEPKPARRKKR